MCIAFACKPGCDVMNFEVNLISLNKPFFLHGKKVVTKTQTSWERKLLLSWNKKRFSSFLKGFQSSLITQIFLEGRGPTLKLREKEDFAKLLKTLFIEHLRVTTYVGHGERL